LKQFSQIGAKLIIEDASKDRWRPVSDTFFTIDISRNRKEGEVFRIRKTKDMDLQILDIKKDERHLLLMAKEGDNKKAKPKKYLCGFDERHWFTCAIPSVRGVSTVTSAKQALKPQEILEAEVKGNIRTKELHKRHRRLKSGQKIHRQGEFMFIPQPTFRPDESKFTTIILHNEPMRRGRSSNAHIAEYLFRLGGEDVMVSTYRPNGVTLSEYKNILVKNPDAKKYNWQRMKANATAYVKGKISHIEHSTVDLGDAWHLVTLNTEDKSINFGNVRFLD
jgi:hypothetical protein